MFVALAYCECSGWWLGYPLELGLAFCKYSVSEFIKRSVDLPSLQVLRRRSSSRFLQPI
jgi:hypothetical protein